MVKDLKSNSIQREAGSRGLSAEAPQRHFCSDALFQGGREVQITHGGEIYRLTVTRQGKLILTK